MGDKRPASQQRATWDRRWARGGEAAFVWYTAEIPPQLADLLATTPLPDGGALDVGCGPGSITAHLAERFQPTIGIDIAAAAIEEAERRGSSARFIVAEVPPIPIEDERLAIVFDRGCMHNIPRERWDDYLGEVARVLRVGGVFELFFAGADAKPKRPIYTPRGFKRRVSLLLGRGTPRRLTAGILAAHLPAAMEIVQMEEAPFPIPGGRSVRFTHAICRRRS